MPRENSASASRSLTFSCMGVDPTPKEGSGQGVTFDPAGRLLYQKPMRLLSTLGVGLLISACGDGVEIEVKRSTQTNVIGVEAPPLDSGDMYIVTKVSLTNNLSDPIALAGPLFAARGTDGVEHQGTIIGELLAGGCDNDSSLAPGGSKECVLVFSAPKETRTEALVYVDRDGNRYEAPMETKACKLCAGSCVDTDIDAYNCGECGVEVGPGAQCKDGKVVCAKGNEKCGGVCTNINSNPMHCGSCDNPVPDSYTCVDGAPACEFGNECDGVCIPRNDDNNCGACGRVCPESSVGGPCSHESCGCDGTTCVAWLGSSSPVTCDSVCAPWGLSCTEAIWVYNSIDYPGECAGTPSGMKGQLQFERVECRCSG